MLWIALYLPDLPLQLAERVCESPRPCVVADGPALRPLVRCTNVIAQQRGVSPGMPVAAARALAGELNVLQRDEASETRALHNLACWAGQFTPNIGVQNGEGLLLEVRSTLRLHGGRARLLARIRQGLSELGYHAEPGVAPTPLAAWLLARARHAGLQTRMCGDLALLPERLAAVPLALLNWPAPILTQLQTLGVHRIGQCLKLPRDGFIRRFGQARGLELDKALGSAPDPRAWFAPPDTFASHSEFGFDVNDALALLFPLKRLLQELEGFLRGRGAGVQEWHLLLDHWNHGKTRLTLRVAAPERSAERFLALARERLNQTRLSGPVLALGIAVAEVLLFDESNRSFFPDPRKQAIGWGHLVDKLTTRLGNAKVGRLCALDDHRPEQAGKQTCAVGTQTPPASRRRESGIPAGHAGPSERARHAGASGHPEPAPQLGAPRPLWLLSKPRMLLTEADAPLCQGRLHLLAGPERIESGWWDGRAARRDYYVARNPRGETFWIYSEHQRGKAWYLHGIFG